MSLNQITSPNIYLPEVKLNILECNTSNIDVENVNTLNSVTINNSGFANFSNGLVATPSIRFTSALDTGIYRPIPKSIGLVCGGTEKMRLDNVLTSLLMPVQISNTISNPTDYVRFSNTAGDTQIRCIGNSSSYISFENPINDIDLQLGIDNSQNAFIKSKTNIKVQDENGNDSVEITRNKNGIKLYNNTVNYTPSSFDYYEDIVIADVTVTGGTLPLTLSGIRFIRSGKTVTMLLPQISVTGNNAPLTISNLVPTRFLPAITGSFYVVGFDSIAVPGSPNQTNGHCDIDSITGNAIFYRTPNHGNFSNTATCGIRASYLTWIVA